MMMPSTNVQSSKTTSKDARGGVSHLMLLLLLAAATPLHPQSSSAFAAASEPAPSSYNHATTRSSAKNLIAIGNKFESTALATHTAIFKKIKGEHEEEDDDDDEKEVIVSSSDLSVDSLDGGASSTTQVPTNEPTLSITYEPTSSGTLSFTTEVPTNEQPTLSNTYEPTPTTWNDDGHSIQGNTNAEEAGEKVTPSPRPLLQPSLVPTIKKKSLIPTLFTELSDSPTRSTEKEGYTSNVTSLVAPSQTPSDGTTTKSPTEDEILVEDTASVISSSLVADEQDCPEFFDVTAFYLEGDIISTQGPLFCRSKGCRIIYKCSVPAFCNVVVPGKDNSYKGWQEIGYCGNISSSLNDGGISMVEGEEEQANDMPSSFSTPSSVVNTDTITQDTNEPHLQNEATPTSRPSPSWYFGFTPTLLTASGNDQNTAQNNNGISVDLPRIICDISLSSSISENFEQKHVLLVVMTKTIYDIFESFLAKELYVLNGVSLNASTKKNLGFDTSSSTIRLHALFTGTVSFPLFAPTQSELIQILLLHFDVSAFNDRLKYPLRLRTHVDDEPLVTVNSVFFMMEDGSLVNAGYKNEEKKEFSLPPLMPSSQDGKEAGLPSQQVEIITVSFVVAAIPLVVAAVILIRLRRMDEYEDEKSIQNVVDKSNDEEEAPPSTVVEKMNESAATSKVEIDVPLTPSISMHLSDISESHEWSSISESLHDYTRDIESPAKAGLGITVARHHHYRQKGTPYIGFAPELWEHNDHLDLVVYEDYIMDV